MPPRHLTALLATAAFVLTIRPPAQDVVRVGFLLPPSIPEVVYFYELPAGVSGEVTGRFVATDVGDAAPPDYVISEATVTLPPGGEASFTLSRPTNGWPLGAYRLELVRGGRVVLVEPFVIQEDR